MMTRIENIFSECKKNDDTEFYTLIVYIYFIGSERNWARVNIVLLL